MTSSEMPLAEVTTGARRLLAETLGAADTARFLQQVGAGRGGNTAERGALYDYLTPDQVVEQVQAHAAARDTQEDG